MTTFAASVTIVDLPVGVAPTGAELVEAVQTSAGVGQSVQLSLNQIATSLGIPTGGATGTILNKSSGANYSTQFSPITTFVAVGTSLATTGVNTSIVAFVANQGITSTQLGNLAVLRANITAVAVGSAQLDAGAVQQSNITANAIGSGQLGSFAVVQSAINTASVGTAQMVAGALGMTLLNTLLPSAIASVSDTTSLTSTYRNYLVVFQNIVPATNTSSFQMQIATSGTAFVSGTYVSMANVNASSINAVDTSTTVFLLTGVRSTTAMQTSTVYGLNGAIRIFNPANTIFRKSIVGEVTYAGAGASVTTATLAQAVVNGLFDGNSNAWTGINFLFSSGNIATGIISIYGMP
jgi:hypothetical protein